MLNLTVLAKDLDKQIIKSSYNYNVIIYIYIFKPKHFNYIIAASIDQGSEPPTSSNISTFMETCLPDTTASVTQTTDLDSTTFSNYIFKLNNYRFTIDNN
jgi:hypothetical protein